MGSTKYLEAERTPNEKFQTPLGQWLLRGRFKTTRRATERSAACGSSLNHDGRAAGEELWAAHSMYKMRSRVAPAEEASADGLFYDAPDEEAGTLLNDRDDTDDFWATGF